MSGNFTVGDLRRLVSGLDDSTEMILAFRRPPRLDADEAGAASALDLGTHARLIKPGDNDEVDGQAIWFVIESRMWAVRS